MRQLKQLSLHLFPLHRASRISSLRWLDVSKAATGTGFNSRVLVSAALVDELKPAGNEKEEDYEQRLWDALWLAHFQLSLESSSSAAFLFTFPHQGYGEDQSKEASLRLRVETRDGTALLGLIQDF